MGRSTKKIRKVRKRFSEAFWKKRSREVHDLQRGICGMCMRGMCRLSAAHIDGLGRRGSRFDPSNPLNEITNLVGLCEFRPGYPTGCHAAFDAKSREERLELGPWMKEQVAMVIRDADETLPGHGRARTGGLR